MIRIKPAGVGLLVFATALTFAWTSLNIGGPGWSAWYRLAKFGQPAVATITAIQAEIHQRCFFKFTVDGVEHHGQEDGCSPLGVGGEFPVTYLPTDPSFVRTGAPGERLLIEILGPLVMAALAGLVSAWRFGRRLDVEREKAAAVGERRVLIWGLLVLALCVGVVRLLVASEQ
jgi:hypothetical protein